MRMSEEALGRLLDDNGLASWNGEAVLWEAVERWRSADEGQARGRRAAFACSASATAASIHSASSAGHFPKGCGAVYNCHVSAQAMAWAKRHEIGERTLDLSTGTRGDGEGFRVELDRDSGSCKGQA